MNLPLWLRRLHARGAASSLLPVLLAGLAVHAPVRAEAELALKPCRLPGFPTELQCGVLKRALDPAQPQGRQIELQLAVVPALARNKLPDPVVFLAGGPGQSAIELLPVLAGRMDRLNQRRDLVFVDQRGTGKSASLACRDERHLPLSKQLDREAMLQELQQCRAELQQRPHGDLRFFSTWIASQDLDAVRQALGVKQWNVIGGSYGTRAGLDYLRQFPGSVRRAVLDGLAPPDGVLPLSLSQDGYEALHTLLNECAAEPGCARAFPELRAQWERLLASLPRELSLRHPLTGKSETVRLQAEDLVMRLRSPLYVPSLRSALPAAIAQAAQGNFDALLGVASGMSGGRGGQLSTGMHFSVICSEDYPRLATRDAAALSGPAAFYVRVCRDWPRGEVPPAFYEMPKAQSPVLLLSGGVDPATAPRHGERVLQALGPLARHELVPGAGHGVMGLPCMRDTLARFIEAKTDEQALALKTDCAARMPLPPAFVPPNPELPAPAARPTAEKRP
jgi:pimeloyl-ACP methyl ester carboxylesterase